MPKPAPKRLWSVIAYLLRSRRGQIFLCNLEAALSSAIVDLNDLKLALDQELQNDVGFLDEDSLLDHLKKALQAFGVGAWSRRSAHGVPEDFSHGNPLITVMSREVFKKRYQDPRESLNGHAFDKVDRLTRRFKESATTADYVWVTPRKYCEPLFSQTAAAEALRDLLGLVHHGKEVELVALYMKPPRAHPCSRPTVIDASPNARFCQAHPTESEQRWGYTVDLAKLDAYSDGDHLVGAPEMIMSKLWLRDCTDVSFTSLGRTRTDRDTASADRRFLIHLQQNRRFQDVVEKLQAAIGCRFA